MTTPTFPSSVQPDWGMNPKVKPRVNRTDFGDGYTQRSSDGINTISLSVSLTWTNVTNAERDTLIDFFVAMGAITAFWWQKPGDTTPLLWTCGSWDDKSISAGYYVVTAVFQQEFDPQ